VNLSPTKKSLRERLFLARRKSACTSRPRFRPSLEALESRTVLTLFDPTFVQAFDTVGVATDPSGNVYVSHDNLVNTLVDKYSPSGQLLFQFVIGNFFSTGTIGHLEPNPDNPAQILDLFPDGEWWNLDFNTHQAQYWGSLKSIAVDTTSIYDIATGVTGNMSGSVVPSAAQTQYGDLAVYKRSDGTDYFFSGLSVGAVPFVLRVRAFSNGSPSVAKVLVSTSDLNMAETQNGLPRGIAVNSQGTVLTTLPFAQLPGFPSYDAAVTFGDGFPESQGSAPTILADTNNQPFAISSRGMTTDKNGNFFIATGAPGTSAGGLLGSGMIVELPPHLESLNFHALGNDVIIDSQDIAVGPNGDVAYVPIDDHNVVIQYAPPALPAGTLQFSAAGYSVAENGGTATITVNRTAGSSGTVTVHYATSNGTATAGQDYTSASGTLTFAPGVTSQTFTIPILDDTLAEPNETVNLTLSGPTGGASLGTQSTAVLTILDNDTTNQVFTVTTAADENDGGTLANPTGADGNLSLREAIELANATAGVNTIRFAIGSGAQTINLLSPLPAVTDTVVIDGTTQPGYAGAPLIELNGAQAGSTSGLNITAGGNTVKGLVINRFAFSGIDLETNGGNFIQGNYIGTDKTGTADLGNTLHGVFIGAGSSGNTIGGTAAGAGNVIAGNNDTGVWISGASGNVVQGNFIGTDKTGTAALGNSHFGILINAGGSNNTIGGTAAGAGNVIAASGIDGVQISDAGTSGNVLQGNRIGTNAAGTAKLGNALEGVRIVNGASGNTVGGTAAGARNLISGNKDAGVWLQGVRGNLVLGNYVGTDAVGTAALGNATYGVFLSAGATGNTVGGTDPGARNVISGNGTSGIGLADPGTANNVVTGNSIGTDKAGGAALGNSQEGVVLFGGASGNTIGGTAPGAGNVISGNTWDGVAVENTGTTGNLVQGNFIGTDVLGISPLGNTLHGVYIAYGASDNTVGGTAAGAGNVIAANHWDGVALYGSGTNGNSVAGNYIGVDRSGTAALGNGQHGVGLFGGPANNVVGGTAAGSRNVISASAWSGVGISDAGTTGNVVQGNFIGTDATGAAGLGNSQYGVVLYAGATGNTVGGSAAGGNTVAFNAQAGVAVLDAATTGNAIRANAIFANGGLGIDLGGDGVTLNDAGDADTGPNKLQNFPSITLAQPGASTHVAGTVRSTANTPLTIDFYASASADPSGYGEGQRYLGSVAVTTDGSGNAAFDVTLAAASTAAEFVTATATDAAGSTSEFSRLLTDIALSQVTADGFATLTVAYQVAASPAPAFRIGFYTSADTLFDGGDTLAGTVQLSDPADLTVGTHTKTFAIGGGAGMVALPGAGAAETGADYYLLAVADDQNLVAEADNDPFNEDNAAVFTGVYHTAGGDVLVHGTGGSDSVALAASGSNRVLTVNGVATTYAANDVTSFRVRGHAGDDTVTAPTLAQPVTVWGGAGNNTLIVGDQGNTTANTYTITSGSVQRAGAGAITYSGVQALAVNGGSGGDTFNVQSTATGVPVTVTGGSGNDTVNVGSPSNTLDAIQGALTVNGQAGTNKVTINDQGSPAAHTYTLTATALARSGASTLTFGTLKTLVVNGGTGGNAFVVSASPGTTAVTLSGGSGTNTLAGPGAVTTWTVSGPGSGTLGTKVSFAAMHDLFGGSANDTFKFTAGSIAGSVNGGGGTADKLDYSALAGPITVNLQTKSAPSINGGAAGGFSGIESLAAGKATTDTLVGPDADTNWTVSSAGGGKAGTFSFSGVENLVGGAGVDVFKFSSSGSIAGTLDGGAAPLHKGNWLDYSGLAAAVTVNLQTGSATKAAGKVANIQDVHGGNGGNTLTGNSQGNILIGGTGSDTILGGSGFSILIGDKGADSVQGGSGGDILIGDYTTYDAMTAANEKALMAILAEWQAADSYTTRVSAIKNGGGLNGSSKLVFGTTVKDDAAADTQTAAVSALALDWFFQGSGDTLTNYQTGEQIN
jgi:CSLREA domain-containing protein